MIGALKVRSQFYYGHTVTLENQYLDYKEGLDTRAVVVPIGSYSLTLFLQVVAAALNASSSTTDFTLTVDRETGQVTFATTNPVDLLISSGDNAGRSLWSLLGFTGGADILASTSSVSPSRSGFVYRPQFPLQSYVPTSIFRRAAQATVSKSASGNAVSVQRFGQERFMECNIIRINEFPQPPNSPIEEDLNALENVIDFMVYITNKFPIEFMEDRSDASTYEILILEKTTEDQDGVGFKIYESFDRGLPYNFETKILKFRLIEG